MERLERYNVGKFLNEIISSRIISISKHGVLLRGSWASCRKCETWCDLISGSIWEVDLRISAVIRDVEGAPSMSSTTHDMGSN